MGNSHIIYPSADVNRNLYVPVIRCKTIPISYLRFKNGNDEKVMKIIIMIEENKFESAGAIYVKETASKPVPCSESRYS